MFSIAEWERECEASTRRSHERRESPHPFPSSARIWFEAALGTVIALYLMGVIPRVLG